MRRTLFVAITLVITVTFLAPALVAAAAPQHALVRLFLADPRTAEFLRVHPGLDIAQAKPGVYAEIVADADDLALLRSSGLELQVIVENLEQHYAARNRDKDIGFGVWHTYSEAVAFVDSLRLLYPAVVSERWSLGTTHEGRDIWCFRLSDNPDVDEDEPEMLLDGMHHAREIMASEFCLMFPAHLAQQYYAGDPQTVHLLDKRELYVVPIVNPDGVVFNELINPDGGGMWRKNRRNNGGGVYGVDINRNYPYEWGHDNGSSGDPSSETYRGPSPGSEPETQALMALINSHEFVTHQTVHTHGNLTLFPWGWTTAHTPDHGLFVQAADVMTQYNGYTPGQPPEVLYEVSGSTTDWAYGAQTEHAKIFSFSNELGGGGDGFWPEPSRRLPLFLENIWPMTYLLRAAGPFVAVEDGRLRDLADGSLDPGEPGVLSFVVANQSLISDLQDIAITVATDDPYLQLGAAQHQVGPLPALQSWDLAADPLPVALDAACPDGHVVTLRVTVAFAGTELTYPLTGLVGQPDVVFSDDFEDPFGPGGWTLTGTWATVTNQSHSPTHSLHDSPGGNYDDGLNITATLNQSVYASSLSFWHRYDIENNYDYGKVQVSTDGNIWNTVQSYTGLQSSWQQAEIDLTPYAGQAVQARFLLETDAYVTEDGWYLDDVVLLGGGSTNLPPAAPVPLAPVGGEVVGPSPTLVVANSVDPDGSDTPTYGFRVYTDPLLTVLTVQADGVAQGEGQTAWTATNLDAGTYWWRAYAADSAERGPLSPPASFVVQPTAAGDGVVVRGPRLAVLGSVAGNQVRVSLDLPAPAVARVEIYDARGARVRELHRGVLEAGARVLVWDGRDTIGRAVASGVYFVRAQLGDTALNGRVTLVR